MNWLTSENAVAMLESIPKQPSDRKLRLFACGCCRHFEDSLTDKHFTEAVEAAEKFADGQTSKAALKCARQSVRVVRHALPAVSTEGRVEWVGLWLAEVTASENAFGQVAHEIQRFVSEGLLQPTEQPPAAALLRCITGNPFRAGERGQRLLAARHLLRCITGNPFRAVAVDPRWRTSEVVTLAQSIHDDAAFDRLPRLANELKNAGCTDTDVLKHCRKGPHGRGC